MRRRRRAERRTTCGEREDLRALVEAAAGFSIYLVLVLASYRFAYTPDLQIAATWPPSGVAFGLLVRTPTRRWPTLLAALGLALVVALTLLGFSPQLTFAWTAADITEPVVGALLARRALPTSGLPLVRPREVYLLFLAGCVAGPVAGTALATAGGLLVGLPAGVTAPRFALGWWASAFLGGVATAPLVLATGWPFERFDGRRAIELVAVAIALVGLLAFGFAAQSRLVQFVGLGIAAFPLLAWAAVRFGPTGAAWGSAATSIAAVHFTLQQRGPFAMGSGGAHVEVLAVQGFFSMAALTALLLASVFAERRRILGGQQLLAESGAILAGFEPIGERLRRVVNRVATHLGDSAALVGRIEGSSSGLLLAGAPVRGAERAQLEHPPPAAEQRCGDTRCWLFVPLLPAPPDGTFLAVRALRRRHYFDPGEVAVAEGLAHRMALALERERLADDAERLFREAKDAVVLREQFLSIASHELKTPLTPLAARLELMRRRVARGQPVDVETIDRAKSSLFKLTWLINDLLDVSRIQAGTLEINRRPIDLAEATAEAIAAFRPADLERIRFLSPPAPQWIDGDPQRIEQVVANLVDNALKYSPPESQVEVRVEPRGREAWLSVRDRGPGVAPEEQARIFERLFRGHRPTGARIGGLGLGLYIVRDIVERHGGRVWVESVPGEGATFRVALPLLEVRGAELSRPDEASAPAP